MFTSLPSLSKIVNVCVLAAVISIPVFSQDNSLHKDLNKSFKGFELVQMDSSLAQTEVGRIGSLHLRAANRDVTLLLQRNDLRSRLFRSEDVTESGPQMIGRGPVNTFRGRIDGDESSEVRLTIDQERIEGYMKYRGETFFVEPAIRYSEKAASDQLVIYRRTDYLGDDGFLCPSDMEEKIEAGKGFVKSSGLAGLEGPGVIELATEADFEYVTALGSAAAANTEILSILNMVEGTFDQELDLSIQVTYQHTWSVQDPYNGTSASTLLNSFGNLWNTDSELSAVQRDMTHLFSAKPAVLSMGFAWIGTVCVSPALAYGLSGRIDWAPAKFLVTAHEIGHNLDASHVDAAQGCGSTIMNSQLSGSTAFTFCPMSRDQVNGFKSGNGSCLAPPANGGPAPFDFDGDARTDTGIFRPGPGEWWYLRSSDGGANAFQFGTSTDKPVPADYTGDGVADVAFWRNETGEWFILRSEDSSFYSFPFGTAGDIPAPADYDGDSIADYAVFRPATATWYIVNSTGGTTIRELGANGDMPVVGDYDGDSLDDVAIFRPAGSEWWIDYSSGGVKTYQFGAAGDIPVPGDYTGDGFTDIAFWRPSTGFWYVLRSEDLSFFAAPFGGAGDIPVPGDYDGDGTIDLSVWRPADNTWYLLKSQDGFEAVAFGGPGDMPLPAAYLP